MALNHQVKYMMELRSKASVVVLPLQYLVDWPMQLIHWLNTNFSTQQDLLEENAKLRARQLLLQAKVQKLIALERENAQLRGLIDSSSHLDGKTMVARILAVNLDSFSQLVAIDKGKNDGVYEGQPVLDAYGVLGQVITVSPMSSYVLLISDTRSALPVQDSRTGVRAIAAGLGYSNKLSLLHIPDTTDIAVGDVLVTSGLGERFPYGYPVGTVKAVDKNTGEGFTRVEAVPTAKIDRSQQVILVWPIVLDKIQHETKKGEQKG